MESSVEVGKKWDVLSRVKNQYGIFCPPHQLSVGCFVDPGEVVWDRLSTLQKMAWELMSMGSFVRLPFPRYQANVNALENHVRSLLLHSVIQENLII